MFKKIAAILIFIGLSLGCTRDDICPEDTPTTPLLIVQFFDFTDTETPKTVSGLRIVDATDPSIELLGTASTDSIAIPLRNFSNATSFSFILNSNSDDIGQVNADEFNVTYTTKDVYVNRACGFIANYEDLSAQIVNEGGSNWIISFNILTTTVANQNETHIAIFH